MGATVVDNSTFLAVLSNINFSNLDTEATLYIKITDFLTDKYGNCYDKHLIRKQIKQLFTKVTPSRLPGTSISLFIQKGVHIYSIRSNDNEDIAKIEEFLSELS